MEIDADKMLENTLRDALREGVKSMCSRTYNNPIDTLVNKSLEAHSGTFRKILEDSIATCVADESFREEIASSVRAKLAKTLVHRFGGEMEKQVNVLKSDPTTRARITLAIEEVVKQTA